MTCVLPDEERDLRVLRRLGHPHTTRDLVDRHLDRLVVLEDLAEERIHLPDRVALLDPLPHLPDVCADPLGQLRVVASRDGPDTPWDVFHPALDPLVAGEQIVDDGHVAPNPRVHPPAHHPAGRRLAHHSGAHALPHAIAPAGRDERGEGRRA
ncbi:MAG: hypothetical protein ACRDJJ_10205 [Actinomycetota bacterium]